MKKKILMPQDYLCGTRAVQKKEVVAYDFKFRVKADVTYWLCNVTKWDCLYF